MTTSTQIQLASRPTGWPTHDNFRTVTVDLPELAEGEVRVANEFISVDPYMRGRMNEGRSYICLLYTSPSPRDRQKARMPSSA